MPLPIHDTHVYDAEVDPKAPNHAHSHALAMVGFNKRVLELGCTGGHFTRALVNQHCTVVGVEIDADAADHARQWADQVIVADLDDAKALSTLDEAQFDAVVAGDVLEHLREPMGTLRRCRQLLKPTGFVVTSIPNVAHADVRMALLDGSFTYRESGLLDTTHLRFFTRSTIQDMMREAGLVIVEVERVIVPIFASEMGIDRDTVPLELVERILADPDAETYQFVVKAVIDDASSATHQLSQRYQQAQAQVARSASEIADLRRQVSDLRHQVATAEDRARVADDTLAVEMSAAVHRADEADARARDAEDRVRALQQTRLFRYAAPARRAYSALRNFSKPR